MYWSSAAVIFLAAMYFSGLFTPTSLGGGPHGQLMVADRSVEPIEEDGVAPLAEMLHQGVRVGFGTDSPASSNIMDMFDEMRTMLLLHRAVERDVVEEPGWKVLGELVHPFAGAAVDLDQVGAGARGDAQAHGRGQVVAAGAALVGDAVLGEADV